MLGWGRRSGWVSGFSLEDKQVLRKGQSWLLGVPGPTDGIPVRGLNCLIDGCLVGGESPVLLLLCFPVFCPSKCLLIRPMLQTEEALD